MTVLTRATPIRAFQVEVASVVRLSPSYARITFAGADLAGFHRCGPLGPRDLRIKVLLPSPGQPLPDLSDLSTGWYPRWLAMDPAVRGAMRTYTVRRARLDRAEPQIDVDFVLHVDADGQGGPASTWAASAMPGERLTLIGPNRECDEVAGIEWQPPTGTPGRPVRVLLAGDETAVPAIGAVLESLPPGYTGHAVMEVPHAEDFQPLDAPAGVEITWLARGDRAHGEPLREAVGDLLGTAPPVPARRRAVPNAGTHHGADGPDQALDYPTVEVDIDREILWDTPQPGPAAIGSTGEPRDFYAWIAGEAATVRDLRRFLVRDLGVDRRSVAFMGYWRAGRAELT